MTALFFEIRCRKKPWLAHAYKARIAYQCEKIACRHMRLYRKSSIREWNELVRRLAIKHSGNPDRTEDSLRIIYRERRQHRPLIICRDGVRVKYHQASPHDVRLEAMRKARERRLQFTCERCGAFDVERKGWRGVCTRSGHHFPEAERNNNRAWREWRNLPRDTRPKNPPQEELSPTLCFKCWAREAPMIRKAKQYDATRIEINRITKQIREIQNGKEHSEQRPTA